MRYAVVSLAVVLGVTACTPPRLQAPSVTGRQEPTSAPRTGTTARREVAATRPTTSTSKPSALLGRPTPFSATAYALNGITKSGTRARRGIVAADPKVIPLGSRIRVTRAGKYSGIYLVEDTGPAVKGRIIDIKVGSVAEAVKFGRRNVRVEVLSWGGEEEASAK